MMGNIKITLTAEIYKDKENGDSRVLKYIFRYNNGNKTSHEENGQLFDYSFY